MISKTNRLVGAILLVSGTTIGAAVLALPLSTGQAGFVPGLVLMTLVWLFLMLTAFYLLEVNLRLRGESNLISMMHLTLGRPGEVLSWIVYLLLLYSLLSSYMVGCGQILSDFIQSFVATEIPSWTWPVGVFFLFGAFVYFGTAVVDFLNRFLMAGLAIVYCLLLGLGLPHVQLEKLAHQDWPALAASAPIVLTTFGYHIIIPTLTTYLEHDARLLKRAIFIGSVIPFGLYVLWQFLTMGILSVSELTGAAQEGVQVTLLLKNTLQNVWVTIAARLFGLFAIVTSLLGVALSLSDFLADGLKIKKTHVGKLFLTLLTFVPPLLFALFYPYGFILALKYAGIFVVILLALFPTLMAWYERYGPETERSFIKAEFQVWGGKPLLIATIIVSLIALGIEIWG